MIAAILIQDLPALALQMALGMRKQVLVVSGGRVVAPHDVAGMPVERARALRPHSCPLTRQPALERAAWEHIVEQVFGFTPLIADAGAGRLYCAVDNMPALQSLMHTTHARVGIASTRTMATLAALGARAGAMNTVSDDEINTYLDALPISTLRELHELELDAAVTDRLALFGLATVGRVRRLTRAQLKAQFGEHGVMLHEFLQSITDASPLPLYVPQPVIESTQYAWEPAGEPVNLDALLQQALMQAMLELGAQRCGRAEVSIVDQAGNVIVSTSRILRAPTADMRHLLVQTTTMLRELMDTLSSRSHVGKRATLSQHSEHERHTNMGGQYREHELHVQADAPLQDAEPLTVHAIRLRLATLTVIPPSQVSLFHRPPTLTEVTAPMARRFPQAIKRVTVLDPHAYLPDRYASIDVWKPAS